MLGQAQILIWGRACVMWGRACLSYTNFSTKMHFLGFVQNKTYYLPITLLSLHCTVQKPINSKSDSISKCFVPTAGLTAVLNGLSAIAYWTPSMWICVEHAKVRIRRLLWRVRGSASSSANSICKHTHYAEQYVVLQAALPTASASSIGKHHLQAASPSGIWKHLKSSV